MFLFPSSPPFHPLIIWLDTARLSDLLVSYFIFFKTVFLITFISFASNICLVFDVSKCAIVLTYSKTVEVTWLLVKLVSSW